MRKIAVRSGGDHLGNGLIDSDKAPPIRRRHFRRPIASPNPMNRPATAMPQAMAWSPYFPMLFAETKSTSARALDAVTDKSATTRGNIVVCFIIILSVLEMPA